MTNQSGGSGVGATEDSAEEFVRLDGAQRRIRDAFFGQESGLFALESDPGTGKSTTSEHIAAEFLARAHRAGVDAPEEALAFVSFTRDDAAAIGPGIAEALETLARDPDHPVDLSIETARELGRRVQRATNVGTVDSVLGSVFDTIATEVGFDDSPAVNDSARLQTVRATCLRRLRREGTHTARLDRLDTAYPGGQYRDDVGDLLRTAQVACRERQLSVAEFRTQLVRVVEETYPGGEPTSFANVRAAIESFVSSEAASSYTSSLSGTAADETDQTAAEAAVLAADQTLYQSWTTAVDDLCTVLERYVVLYDEAAREEGVVSHLDIAHWVAAFFDCEEYAGAFRERLRERYTERLSAVLVDEAQDVSAVQHDALGSFVDDRMRVLLVGDYKQCVFLWRNALPRLFRTAIEEERYFGIDWDTCDVEHEQRTRRCRPDVAAAVDTVFADVFGDPARGGDEVTGSQYTPLAPTRAATAQPNVHVASVTTPTEPGQKRYVAPDTGTGEATALARCLADGLTDGTLADPDDSDGESPTVTVLFSRRKKVDSFVDAFEREGLVVGDATKQVFATPLSRLLEAVCVWLADPSKEALRTLAEAPVLAETKVPALFELQSWSIEAIAAMEPRGRAPVAFVHALDRLLDRRPRLVNRPLPVVLETVIDELDLWRDPLGLMDDPETRVDVLDELVATADNVPRSETGVSRLAELFTRLCANPNNGPTVSVGDEASYDVVCRTIHSTKGAEDDVIALGDIGDHIAKYGPHTETLATLGDHLALAPPTCDPAADVPALPGFEHGLFDVERHPWDYDAGLRWVTQRWADDDRLAGSPPLRALSHANRAERWRLLYVALTRARNHLVLPLPTHRNDPEPRDRWVDTLREALGFDETKTGTYACPTPSGDSFDVRVHYRSERPEESTATASSPTPFVATLTERDAATWTPRFVNPSTLYPLVTDPERHVLDYLQRRPLHSDHDGIADGLPLTFETMGPEDVGDVGHAVLATAIRHRVDTETLRTCSGVLRRKLQYALVDRADRIAAEERERLRAFVADVVCPQFAESALWSRLQEATAVYVEEPVDTLVRVDGVDRELQGIADVLSVDSTGAWYADEVKLTLQPTDPETQARYRLQAQVYAWAVSKQVDGAPVTPAITQLGVVNRSQVVDWDTETVLERLHELP